MPQRHGIYCKVPPEPGRKLTANEATVFRYGICGIFDALRTGAFLTRPDDQMRAAQLENHFRTICQRFVFTLQELNGLMHELASCRPPGGPPLNGTMAIYFKAECLADHVLTYLNTIVDDVAIMIALACHFVPARASNAIDSMGKLRGHVARDEPAFAAVRPMLIETDNADSWWHLGFARATGARQLMVHNQHLVRFQVSHAPGGPIEVQSVVMSPFAQQTFAVHDFFDLQRRILSGLFAWLDRLELLLISVLQAKVPGWSPLANCPCFLLPVGYPAGTTRYDREYFPIPICDGSDELPWSVSTQPERKSGDVT